MTEIIIILYQYNTCKSAMNNKDTNKIMTKLHHIIMLDN